MNRFFSQKYVQDKNIYGEVAKRCFFNFLEQIMVEKWTFFRFSVETFFHEILRAKVYDTFVQGTLTHFDC